MTYHAFYINDDLIIRIKNKPTTSYEKKGNVVALYNGDELVGYNIFNYQDSNLEQGLVKLNQGIHENINNILSSEDLPTLELDIQPKFVVGYVESLEKHPESTKLNIAQVDLGNEKTQIVCGAANIAQGQKVVVALVGAVLKDGLWIAPGKLLKVDSNGMICSLKELGLATESQGIHVLDDSYQVGEAFIA